VPLLIMGHDVHNLCISYASELSDRCLVFVQCSIVCYDCQGRHVYIAGTTPFRSVMGIARIKNWGWPKMDEWSEWPI